MTTNKLLFTAFAAASALAMSAPAQAQVTGSLAVVNPSAAVLSAKALSAALQQVRTTYKANYDAAAARSAQLQREVEPLVKLLDADKNGDTTDAEIQAARQRNDANLGKIETAQRNANNDIQRQLAAATLAEAYAIEMVSQKYNAAQAKVVADKRIGALLAPEAFVYAPAAANVTAAITAEIDRTTPSVAITPPAGWQPTQQTMQLYADLQRALEYQARAAAAQAARPAAGAPGTPAPAPAPTQPTPAGR